jgi:hypothetical protein
MLEFVHFLKWFLKFEPVCIAMLLRNQPFS